MSNCGLSGCWVCASNEKTPKHKSVQPITYTKMNRAWNKGHHVHVLESSGEWIGIKEQNLAWQKAQTAACTQPHCDATYATHPKTGSNTLQPESKLEALMTSGEIVAEKPSHRGFMQSGSSEYRTGIRAGLAPDFGVTQAVADFYSLEEMQRSGYRAVDEVLDRYEAVIAHQFSLYIDMAIGGELRHLPNSIGGDEEDGSCNDWDNCCAVPCCSDLDCGCGKCGETYCPCVENQVDEDGEPIECQITDCECAECKDPDCGCYYESDYDCECGDCSDCGLERPDYREFVSNKIAEFIDDASDYSGRSNAWEVWLRHRRANGPNLVVEAYKAFKQDVWPSAYGGDAWALCAQVLADYLGGKIKRRTFIDRCFTLQHNGGCIFNKVYATEKMAAALDTQAQGNYDKLVSKWASEPVRRHWAYFNGTLKATKQGRKHLAEQLVIRDEEVLRRVA